MRKGFFYMISDFKYLLKEDSLKYLLANGIVQDFISLFSTLGIKEGVEQKSQHIFFASDGYFVDSLDYHYLSIKLAFRVFREIDYLDIDFNRKIASYFVENIQGLKPVNC